MRSDSTASPTSTREASNGIDPGKLDALQFDQLMTRWTEEAHDMLGSDGCDIIPDSLDNAIQALGIDRESIEA